MNRMSKHRGPSSSLGTLSNSGWNTKRLGELAELDGRIGWRGLTAQEYTKSGPLFLSVHSLNYGDVVDFRDAFHITQARYDESPEIMLRLGDILICKDGAGIGKVGIVAELPSQATINSSLLLIRPANSILPKYLYYCLSSPYFQQIVLSRLNGATTPHLYQRDITDFPVHFPCFTEQERIVAILDKAFGGIERASIKCGMALENTRDAFESYRDLLFADSAGGVGKRLDELVSFRNGVNFTKSSRGKTVAIVGVKDFQNRFSTPTEDLAYVTIDGDVNEEDVLRVNDLLTVRSNGNVDLIGRTMLVEECPQDALHSGFTIRTRIMTDDIWPRYLCHFMRSRTTRRRQLIDGGTGTNIKSLNQGALASLVCPFPSIARQRFLANELDQIADATERLQSVYKEKQSLLDALKRSLLHQAFSGQLREQTSKAVVIPFPIPAYRTSPPPIFMSESSPSPMLPTRALAGRPILGTSKRKRSPTWLSPLWAWTWGELRCAMPLDRTTSRT